MDPWQQFLDEHTTSSDNSVIRRMIAEIQNVAEETGAAIILAGNYTKNLGAEIRRGLGGSELANTLRSVLTIVQPSADNPSPRLLTVTKMSYLGKEVTPVGLIQRDDYAIEYRDYHSLNGDVSVVRNASSEPYWNKTDDEAKRLSKGDKTVVFQQRILADGPMDSNDVKKHAKDEGFSMATINRVKGRADVRIEKQSDKSSLWYLK